MGQASTSGSVIKMVGYGSQGKSLDDGTQNLQDARQTGKYNGYRLTSHLQSAGTVDGSLGAKTKPGLPVHSVTAHLPTLPSENHDAVPSSRVKGVATMVTTGFSTEYGKASGLQIDHGPSRMTTAFRTHVAMSQRSHRKELCYCFTSVNSGGGCLRSRKRLLL